MAKTAASQHDEPLDRERALSTAQASEIIGAATITMTQWRAHGEGPPFFRIGKRHIRYRLGDLLDWRDQHTVGKRRTP